MLIQHGIKHKKFLGLHLKVKAPNFHTAFGSTAEVVGDFNLDSALRIPPNQNIEDPIFHTQPQPEGCGGEGIASVMGDSLKKLCSPFFSYSAMCQAMGQSTNQPCLVTYILNEPVVSGVQGLDGTITKSPQWYEVTTLNGSLFQGILSAMIVGGASVVHAGTWYESFDTPINGVVSAPSGQTSGHFWKFSGQKTINDIRYLIAYPWLGGNWADEGKCYFSQQIVDTNGGQAFTPKESPNASEPAPLGTYSILTSLINFFKELLNLEQGGTESIWQVMEDELEDLQIELNHITMNEELMYEAAKNALGKPYTLDPSTPPELRCAEAWSDIATQAGVTGIPTTGFENTDQVNTFLATSGQFELLTTPELGATVIAVSKVVDGAIAEHGHVTVCAAFGVMYNGDWGLISNDSSVGIVREQWGYKSFMNCYTGLGLEVKIYRRL